MKGSVAKPRVGAAQSTARLVASLLLVAIGASCASAANSAGGTAERDASGSTSPDAPTFGLSANEGPFRLDVSEVPGVGGQAISVEISRDVDARARFDSQWIHIVTFGRDLSHFRHEYELRSSDWLNVDGTGPIRVVTAFEGDGRSIVLGADVTVDEESDFGGALPNPTQTSTVIASGVLVERDGWSFEVVGTRPADPLYRVGAWLTIVREEDLAVSFDQLAQVGDGTYRFDPELLGAGSHVAVLEVSGAPAFSFRVHITADGSVGQPPNAEILRAVESFVQAVDDRDVDGVLALSSSRCRARLSDFVPTEVLGSIDADPRYWVTSADAEVSGSRATVTYETVEGEYVVGQTPRWRERIETWTLEDSGWVRDACEPDGLAW